ncbi:MAG: sensor histidine kinase, partial [Sphingomonadales bacterium]
MIANSLRLRLLAGAAVAIALALAIAWGAMSWVFDRHIESRVQDELTAQAVPLLAGLSLPGGTPALEEEPADPRFGVPASGLYWQVSAAK